MPGARLRTLQFGDGWTDGHDYIPNEYVFSGLAGMTMDCNLGIGNQESDYFRLFVDDEVVGVMVDETNRYHTQCVAARPQERRSKMKK